VLTRQQKELAKIGETLSPARVYGYRAGGGAMSDTDHGTESSDTSSQFSSDVEALRFSDGSDEGSDSEGDAPPPRKEDLPQKLSSASQAKKRSRIILPASEEQRSRRAGQNTKLDESILAAGGTPSHRKAASPRVASRIEGQKKAVQLKRKGSKADLERQVGELCEELPVTRRQATELLLSSAESGKDPVVEARALYWKRECEASRMKEADAESRARELSQSVARSASQAAAAQGSKSGDFQPTIDLPEDWASRFIVSKSIYSKM
jgi:hypothetical protein